MSHTPTPWIAKQKFNNEFLYQLFALKTPKPTTRLEIRIDWDKEGGFTKADAAHIVRCVNAYPQLVEALKNLVTDWERVHGTIPEDHEAKVALAAAEKGA